MTEKDRSRRRWVSWARWVGTAVLLAYVFSRIDVGAAMDTLRGADLVLMLAATAVLAVSQALRVVRWRLVTSAFLDDVSWRTTVRSWLAGFAGAAVAGEGLGTIAMGLDVRSPQNTPSRIVMALTIEKFYEVTTLALFVAMVLPSDLREVTPRALIGAAAIAVLGGIVLVVALPRLVEAWLRRRGSESRFEITVGRHLQLFSLSISARFVQFVFVFLTALALNIDIGLVDTMAVMTLAGFAVMLPISISGLGPREVVMVELFDRLELAESSALALAFAIFAIVTAARAISGIVWATTRSRPVGQSLRPEPTDDLRE